MDSIVNPLNNWTLLNKIKLFLKSLPGIKYIKNCPENINSKFIPQKLSCSECGIPSSSQCHYSVSGKQTHSIKPLGLSNPKFATNENNKLQITCKYKWHQIPLL